MNKVNFWLSLLTANAVLIILERLSPTTKILLQPYSFLRVHEAVQILIITTISIIISFYLFKEISNDFALLKTKRGVLYGLLYLVGTYFYATGNGYHEIASFLFNNFCNTQLILTSHPFANTLCASMFVNDYIVGNILYFVGLLLTNVSFIFLEIQRKNTQMNRKNITISVANGLVYALAFIAYAVPDPVTVGIYFLIFASVIVNYLLFTAKQKPTSLPFTLYCSVGYTVGAVVSLILRFH